jgi:hypothetical protein
MSLQKYAVHPADPGVGVQTFLWKNTLQVPLQIETFHFVVVNGVGVANRIPVIAYVDSILGSDWSIASGKVAMVASQTFQVELFNGSNQGSIIDAPGFYSFPFPQVVLRPGDSIKIFMQNFQAADFMTGIYLTFIIPY